MRAIYNGPNQQSSSFLIEKLLHPPFRRIAVDTETVSLKNKTCIGIGIAINSEDTFYIPILPVRSEILEEVYALLTDPTITKTYHNGNFDMQVLRQFAVAEGLDPPDYWAIQDTNLMANVSGLPPDLHTLGKRLLNYQDLFTIQELLTEARQSTGKKAVTMLDVPMERIALKCCNDVRTTFNLFDVLNRQLTTKTRDCYDVDKLLTSHLKMIETKGLKLNNSKLRERYNELADMCELYEDKALESGFSISSPMQVGMHLANMGIVLPLTKSHRQLDTSVDVLERINNPIAQDVVAYRKLRKTLGTYVEPFFESDRQYTHFRLDLATGRLASSGMDCPDHVCTNQQNVPPELRDMYVPDSGIFTYGDMSQLEMRVFAYITKDKVLLDAYHTGKSVHEITFRSIYPQMVFNKDLHEYTLAKTFNFAMIYDANDSTLADQCKIGRTLAHNWKREWKTTYPEAAQYMLDKVSAKEDIVETIFGRQMLIPTERGEAHADKCRLNYPVQGSGADLNKRALLKILQVQSPPDVRLQVHDEFLIDGDYEFPESITELYPGLPVPFEVKKGKVWM